MEAIHQSDQLYELLNRKAGRPQPVLRPFERVVPKCAGCFNPDGVADQLPLKHVDLGIKIEEASAELVLTQAFENTGEAPIEVLFQFPADPDIAVTKMRVKVGDKEVETQIMEKAKAEAKYDDATAGGNTGVMAKYDEDLPDVCNLQVGQLQPGKTAEITVTLVTLLQGSSKEFYSLLFPLVFLPESRAGDLTVSINAEVKSQAAIERVYSSVEASMVSESEDGTGYSFTYAGGVPKRDLEFAYASASLSQPKITLQQSAEHPDEVVAQLSFIPKAQESTETEDSDEEDMAPGEFIFVIDRSGSMGFGSNRIDIAKQALTLFLQSIPPGSKFDIISFGSHFQSMFGGSVDYSQANLETAINQVAGFGSDFGGTQLFEPMQASLDRKPGNLVKSIFVLTDGQVHDRHRVQDYIRKNCHTTRVHSFGIGSGADTFLVKEMAKAGKGKSFMIEDNDPSLQSKVIQALKLATAPSFTSVAVNWGTYQGAVQFQTPDAEHMEICFEGDPLVVQAIIKKDAIESASGNAQISLFNTLTGKEWTGEVPYDTGNIADTGFGFQLAAKKFIQRSENLQLGNKDEQTKWSLKYQVLCKHTAMFGKIKNKTKSDAEQETVEMKLKPAINKPQNSGGYHAAPSSHQSP